MFEIEQYLSDVKEAGDNIRSRCPFCSHKRAFLANKHTGWFICFSCNERGTLRKLLHTIGVPEKQIRIAVSRIVPQERPGIVRKRERNDAWPTLPDYILGAYHYTPKAMVALGFDKKLLREHEVGFDKERQRITFPIRDVFGRLVAVSGRAEHEWQSPRYLVYDYRDVFKDYRISNRRHLYLFNTVYPKHFFSVSTNPVILVEGYKAALWLQQHGHDAVALQGSSITESQIFYLNRLRGEKYVFLDNELGKQRPMNGYCDANKIVNKLHRYKCSVKVCKYPTEDPKSPDDLSPSEIQWAINNATNCNELQLPLTWKRKK